MAIHSQTSPDPVDEDDELVVAIPKGAKNYITPAGHARLRAELKALLDEERPELVRTVAWAASNGDRSENGDYIYGKKRLREIDRRIRFLTKRLENAEVVDPRSREDSDQVFFGATVTWFAPIARAHLKARIGDVVSFQSPRGLEEIEIIDVRYEALGE